MKSVIELPFNQHVGLQIADDPAKALQLPSGTQYLNHLSTVHASAQLALAEASSGEFLRRSIGDLTGIESVKNELSTKGRALVSVEVELHDESGAYTLSATVEWFITRVAEK